MTLAGVETEVATIQTIGGVLIALVGGGFGFLGVVLDRTRRHAKATALDARATREQVVNSHETNLRDELDQRHAETIAMGARHDREHKSIRKSITRLEDHLGLEHTQPPPPRRRTR